MSQCPRCDVPMVPELLGAVPVESCRDCGGTWVVAGELSKVVRETPAELAPLDRRYADRHLPPPLTQPDPLCPNCGHNLDEHRVNGLEQVPLQVCKPCRMLFVPDGQLEAIHTAVSPETLPPEPLPEPEAEEEMDEEEATKAEVRELWLRSNWPARVPDQPWLSWAIPSMPLWCAALLLLPAAVLFAVVIGLREESFWAGFIGLPETYVNVVVRAFGLTVALWVTWGFTGGRPMPFGYAYRMLLPVGAVAMLAVAATMCIVLPTTQNYDAVFFFDLALRFALYRWALELEWQDVAVLVLVQGVLAWLVPFLPSGIGLG